MEEADVLISERVALKGLSPAGFRFPSGRTAAQPIFKPEAFPLPFPLIYNKFKLIIFSFFINCKVSFNPSI